jgi:cytochrome P450
MFLHDIQPDGDRNTTGELFGDMGEQIGHADPPRHRELRRVASPWFTPLAVTRLKPAVERFCDQLFDTVVPGEAFDFVEQIAAVLPMLVACEMLGIPGADHRQIRAWSDELERVGTTDLSDEELAVAVANFSGMMPYLEEIFEEKRKNPGDDFISSLLSAELDNEKLSAANVMMFTQTMIAAGNDTTRALLSGIVATLAEHPDQYQLVKDDISLVPNAVDEVMRYVTPARGFVRTAMETTEIRGQEIKPMEHVYLAYDACNRDEEVFSDAETFDVTRPENNLQIAFGFGTHVCIAASLVRMETKVFLEKFIERFPTVEIVGKQRRTETVLRSGWLELPVALSA